MIRAHSSDPDDSRIATAPRELDSRASDGIYVQLLWHPLDRHVSVAVSDAKTGEAFELEVRDGESALEIFHHPYVFAAGRRLSGHLAGAERAGFEPAMEC